jgi:hypothetical protein
MSKMVIDIFWYICVMFTHDAIACLEEKPKKKKEKKEETNGDAEGTW